MNRVSAKIAVEVLVHFEQHNGHAATCEEKRKHRTTWTAADNTARSCLYITLVLTR
jgi:hypothetical protein